MKAVVVCDDHQGGDDDLERRERESRSLALEKAYVHDVYDQLSHQFSDERYRPWPRVRSFLEQLEPGSIVCDAGCGNGKYLAVNPAVFKLGSDRCATSVEAARRKDHEVLICDALNLPYRDESFDAALSIAVIHHLATRDRRVRALRELARILRVGGRILITVWAKEQRHRKFESQDILVPWRTPDRSSSEEKSQHEACDEPSGSTGCCQLTSAAYHHHSTTTNTSDEDVTHYHAYTQTSESDSCCHSTRKLDVASKCSDCPACAGEDEAAGFRRVQRSRHHHKGRSVDPHRPSCSSQSSSDLSSPSDSCYSFVRKALQKLASTRRAAVGGGHYRRSWFTHLAADQDQQAAQETARPLHALEAAAQDPSNELPIELRHLDSEEDGLPVMKSRSSPPSLGGGDSGVIQLFHRSGSSSSSVDHRRLSSSSLAAAAVTIPTSVPGSRSLSLSDLLHTLTQQVTVGSWLKHRLSEEDPTTVTTSSLSPASEASSHLVAPSPQPSSSAEAVEQVPIIVRPRPPRPLLTKQKRAVQIFESYCEEEDVTAPADTATDPTKLSVKQKVLKQGSMNDSLLSAGRLDEREKLKRSLPPRQVTWSGAPSSGSTRVSPLPPLVKSTSSHQTTQATKPPSSAPSSEIGDALKDFRSGFARIWQSLRGEPKMPDDRPSETNKPWLLDSPSEEFQASSSYPAQQPSGSQQQQAQQSQQGQALHQQQQQQQRPPSLLEKRIKSFCGWATVSDASSISPSSLVAKALSPSPRRIPPSAPTGEEDFFNFSLPRCCAEQDLSYKFGGTHPHRLSYHKTEAEGSSDSSSKDSSLQSDTSVDSEDSCVSVIYVPRSGLPEPEGSAPLPTTNPQTGTPKRQSSSSSSEGSPVVKVFPASIMAMATGLPITHEVVEAIQPSLSPEVLPAPIVESSASDSSKCLSSSSSSNENPQASAAAVSTDNKEALVRSMLTRPSGIQNRLLSFDVFNPETDDVDSDSDREDDDEGDRSITSESSSTSNSAGSVISVGDPMWPAFQDRRQTILSGSSLDIPTTSSCDGLIGSNNSEPAGDNSSLVLMLAKQDSNDSWPASIEADPTHLGPASRNNLTSSPSAGISSLTADCYTYHRKSPSPGSSVESSLPTAVRSQQDQQQADVEEWRLRSSLGPLDECHEEETNEISDRFSLEENRPIAQQQQSSCQQQWRMERQQVKSSFSASTSSLDSSVSAPSFSSTRQSSSASALSVDASMMRKNSDDSAVLSTLPLLGSRPRPLAFSSASAHHHHHHVTAAASTSSTGSQTAPSRSISKPSCDEEGQHMCFKPLNKLIASADRQRSADRDSSLSVSTSQDSLPSDTGGAGGVGGGPGGSGGQTGTVTLHRYYHVFRQGELDQLIERYVENLHIITSYYDHANWCVVAEKVHVWTI